MYRFVLLPLMLLAAPAVLATSYFATDIPINSGQQVPQQFLDGHGSYDINYSDDSGIFCWTITFDQLSGPATAMHFHGAAAVGANSGVQLNVGNLSGLSSPSSGCEVIDAAQGTDLLNGLWYLNIHTTANPGGEIRGQAIGLVDTDSGIQTEARILSGQDPLVAIGGRLDAANDDHTDCYCLSVSNPETFYITTDPGVDATASSEVADSRLWLWNYDGDQVISGNDDSPNQTGNLSVISDPNGPITYPQAPINPVQDALQSGDAVLACISYFDNSPIDALGMPLVDFGTAFEALNGPNPAAGPFDSYVNPGTDGVQEYSMAVAGARGCHARYELLHNPDFSRSVQYWSAPGGVNLSWQASDGHLTANGAAQLTVNSAPDTFAFEQCVDARYEPEDAVFLFELSAKQPDAEDVQINVISYATADCQAQTFFNGSVLDGSTDWVRHSMLVERSSLDFHIPSASYKIQFTAPANSPGTALVDDVSFQNVLIFRGNFD